MSDFIEVLQKIYYKKSYDYTRSKYHPPAINKKSYKLFKQIKRITKKLDSPEVRGTCMNFTWLNWMGKYMETQQQLESMGFDLQFEEV